MKKAFDLRYLIVFLALVVSGGSSLVLETVWARQLQLLFGSSTLAVSTILVTYMLGLAIGARMGGVLADRVARPLLAYGALEFGIGLCAVLSPLVIEWFFQHVQPAVADMAFGVASLSRFVVCQLFFCIPTLLMGATLPLAVQGVVVGQGPREAGGPIGALYGANTTGAVLGVLLATVLLLPILGQQETIYAAGLSSTAIGLLLIIVSIARNWRATGPHVRSTNSDSYTDAQLLNIGLTVCAITGFVALTMEVVWTRLLAMIIGSSIYSFATVLGVFLVGIALGSFLAATVRFKNLSSGYGFALLLAAITIPLGSSLISSGPQILSDVFYRFGISPAALFGSGLFITMIVILPSTLIFGWLVPTLCRILEARFTNPGRLIATIYFWNTIGAALGAFCSAYLLIRFIGTERTIQLSSLTLLLSGLLFLYLSDGIKGRTYLPVAGLAVTGLATVFGIQLDRTSLTSGIFYQPHQFVDFGLEDLPFAEPGLREHIVYYEEGLNGTVSIHRTGDDIGLRVNGKTDASIGDMSTQILLGALPMMFGPKVEKATVIGLGSGVTPGSALLHEPAKLFVAELEGAVVRASSFFDGINNKPLSDSRVTVVEDDGRLFLASTSEKFDVIISEPSNPWISGASSLFTAEFFELASARLTESGRLMQWVQLYGMDEKMVLALIGAMRQSFDWVYGFRSNPLDSDLMLMGMNHPLSADDLPEWDRLPERARQDLERLELSSTADLLALMEFGPSDIDEILDGQRRINSDDNLYIELRGPLHAYESLDPVHEFIGSASTSWAGVENINLSAERLAEIALSQMWHRSDLALAELLARESLQIGVTPLGQIAVAQWGLYANPEKEALSATLIEDALSVDPDNGYARHIRAELRYEAGDMSGALEDIDISIARGVDPAASYRLRLAALTDLELLQEAEALVDKLVDAPFFELEKSILRDAAIIKRQVGDTSEAIKLMRQFLQYDRTDEEAWKMLSGWLTEAGSAEDAALARENAEIVRQNSATFMHREIRALLGQGEEEAVMTLWDQLEKLYPDYRNLGMLHDDVQRLTGGISTSP